MITSIYQPFNLPTKPTVSNLLKKQTGNSFAGAAEMTINQEARAASRPSIEGFQAPEIENIPSFPTVIPKALQFYVQDL